MSNLSKLAQGGFAQSKWLTKAAQDLTQRDLLDALQDVQALRSALVADFNAIAGKVQA